MLLQPFTMNPSFLAMVRGVRELHLLMAEGKEDSPEADAIRDATDAPWESLSEIERRRVRTLSEDLYSLLEPSAPARPINPRHFLTTHHLSRTVVPAVAPVSA